MLRCEPWLEADALFRSNPRWRGGDDAYSVMISKERRLWLFGDSFIALHDGAPRRQCATVHNTVAVQHGRDPATASMRFVWREERGRPASFIADDGDTWFWPGGALRLGDALLLFLMRVTLARSVARAADMITAWRQTDSLSFFEVIGWDARLVMNLDAAPEEWDIRPVRCPDADDVCIAGPALLDGSEVCAAGFALGEQGWGARIWRWPVEDATCGDLSRPVAAGEDAVHGVPREFSLHREHDGSVTALQADAVFGAGIAVRTAPSLHGPWSVPQRIFTPPESERADALVYAAKAHPRLCSDGLAITYASIGLTADLTLDDESLYYPRTLRAWR